MSGWIKIYRDINKHWIWKNPEYLKWWLDILIEANYESQKILINGTIIECNRGEKVYSLDTWAKRWGTNKSKVRRFLSLLEKDNMIRSKSETKTTRISVCKYDSYQDERNADETQTKRIRNADETQTTPIKERKEIKEIKEVYNRAFDFKKSLINLGGNLDLVSDWLAVRKTKKATNTKTAFDSFVKELKLSGAEINEILRVCVENNWSGFKAEWYKNKKINESGNKTKQSVKLF